MAEPTRYIGKLKGQRVLIFGGSSGLGYGAAEALLEHGSEVIISSSSQQKVDDRVKGLNDIYPKGRVSGYACNLGGNDAQEQIANLFSKVGTLDHVIHSAGDQLRIKDIEEWNLPDMHEAGAVRFFSIVLIAQHLRKHLKPGPSSSFTVTSGYVAEHPTKNWTVINGFATGLVGLTRGLALDLAPVRVNCLMPGAVETELWDSIKAAGQYDGFVKRISEASATKTIGKVEDVVEAYLYVLKDKNITGQTIVSNSGTHLL